MSSLARHFADYEAYHTDPRNEATHLAGIPMIVLSILIFAANVPLFEVAGARVDLGWLLVAAVTLFYVALNLPLGLVMGLVLALMHLVGLALLGANVWVAVALFVGGWALQFVGHAFEGKRPAFLKNGIHLLVGPLWITSRLLARVGLTPARFGI